jgi:lipopolysaccharide export system protein LptA
VKLPSGEYNNFIGGGIVLRCPAKKITLKADSAEIFGDEKRIFLVGKVDYQEPRFALTSDYLTYYTGEERVVATGHVNGRLPTGSTLQGPQADYRRAIPRTRPRAQLSATARPIVTIVQRDASGRADPPIIVVAQQIYMDGDSLLYGSGAVEIKRPELTATADSVFLNTGLETMRLMRDPVVQGTRDRPFKLVGELIDVFSRQRKLQRVVARSKAVANSQDLTLRADTIDLRFITDMLQRAYAWGTSRARAVSPTQSMTADSIDVIMPAQRVREVHSVRAAVGEGRADSVRFKADEPDWLRGDTIFTYFDSLPPRDTTQSPRIRRLVASGEARSLYHLAPSDSAERRPAISYSKGRKITINFDDQRVAKVTVEDKAVGMYLEPNTPAADTGKARPGTGRPPGRAAPRTQPAPTLPPPRPGVRP